MILLHHPCFKKETNPHLQLLLIVARFFCTLNRHCLSVRRAEKGAKVKSWREQKVWEVQFQAESLRFGIYRGKVVSFIFIFVCKHSLELCYFLIFIKTFMIILIIWPDWILENCLIISWLHACVLKPCFINSNVLYFIIKSILTFEHQGYKL